MFLNRLFLKRTRHDEHFQIARSKYCAFTEHRPKKLYEKEVYVIVELRKEIVRAISDGHTTFITCCSQGVDLWAADIVLELQRCNKDLHLACAIPFPGFDERWPVDRKKYLQFVKKKADHIQTVEQAYNPESYQKRNAFMCDHASRIIAVCDGKPSGVRNTIDYAKTQRFPARLIEL